jgi:hypothetical protein
MIITFIIIGLAAPVFSQNSDEEARKYLVRGMAAIEMAKSEDDLAVAVAEFKKATEIAPDMAAAWYNLGSVQSKTGQINDAIASYRRYLKLAPQAEDARRISDEIIKLEFRQEQATKVKSRAGTWVTEDGTSFRLALDGNRMTLVTGEYFITDADAESTYPIAGKIPITTPVTLKYNLALQGNKISGSWSRSGFKAEKCTVPEDNGEVTGELREADHVLILRYTFTKYHAYTQMSILTDDFCSEVVAVEKKDIEKKFFGPLPQGGIGVYLGGIHSYWPGGFSMVKFGWSGHLTIAAIKDDSPAFAAGLRKEDEIIAIDNAAVATLSGSDALRKLRGEPGSEVVLSIMRKKKPVDVRLRRVAITDEQFGMN